MLFFCLIIPRLMFRRCLIGTHNRASFLMRWGRCLFAFFGSHEADKLKKVCYFLPHDSASNFEALPRRNSQQLTTKFGEAPRRRPKIRHQECSRGISCLLLWAPGSFIARPHASKCLPSHGHPTLPDDPVTSRGEPTDYL